MKKIKLKPNEPRKDYLLRVAIAFLEDCNCDNTVIFDEAECDSYCLIEDIKKTFLLD